MLGQFWPIALRGAPKQQETELTTVRNKTSGQSKTKIEKKTLKGQAVKAATKISTPKSLKLGTAVKLARRFKKAKQIM